MKHKFRLLLILIFFQVLFVTCAAFGEDQSEQKNSGQSIDWSSYRSVTFGFLEFYRNQVGFLQANIRNLLDKTWLDEFLLKRTMITSDVQYGHYPATLPSLSTYQENLASMTFKPAAFHDPAEPTLYARVSSHLRSPILAPYKYKTATNTLLSVIVPIPATKHLTIIPVVSCTFSINGSDRTDLRNKSLFPDKDGSVMYGGINLTYTF